MRDPQRQLDAGALILSAGDAEEVVRCEVLLEYQEHLGPEPVVVGRALRGAAIVEGRTARRGDE